MLMGKIIGLIVATVLLVGGFLYWNSQSKPAATEAVTAPEDATPSAMKEGGVVSSIKEAMGLGQKMQCTYSMTEGGKAFESKVVVDGEKYASTTTIDAMTVYGVFDGEDQYSWTSGSQTGMKMSKACLAKLQESAKDLPTSTETQSATAPQDIEKAFDLAKNVKCEAASGADFTIPKDVTFTDQCAMMEQSLKMMEDMKSQMPSTKTMPGKPAAY